MISFPLVTFAVLAFFSPSGTIYDNDIDRKKWVGRLYQDQFKGRYRRIMTPLLDRIDVALSADETTRDLGPYRIAWSHRLLTTSILLAVAYPIATVILQWLSGAPITFGGETVLEAGTPQARLYVVLWLGVSLLLYFLAERLRSGWRTALFIAATLILIGGQYFSDTFEVPRAFKVAVTVASTVAVAHAFAFAGVFAVAVASAVAVAYAFAGTAAVAGVFAGAVAVAAVVAVEKRDDDYGLHPKRTIALIWLYLAGLTFAVRFGTFDTDYGFAASAFVILFLGVFPLFNTLADFASIGLTRFLLRQGINGMSWWKAVIDLFGGAIIFLCLGCALITWVHLVKSGGEISLMDLSGLFEGLRTNPSDYWWLAIMLGTTLLPTLLHAAIGIFTCLITYPEPLRAWIVNGLSSGGATAGWRASLTICALISLSLWVPLIIFYHAMTFDKGILRDAVISVFEGYARLIGTV